MPTGVVLRRLAKDPVARFETVCQRNRPPDHQRGDTPILRLGAADAPMPYNPDLERASVPQTGTIEAAARRLVRRKV